MDYIYHKFSIQPLCELLGFADKILQVQQRCWLSYLHAQKNVRTTNFENIAHAKKHSRRNVIEILPLLHNVEVVVGFYVEQVKNLVQHFSVLTCNANYCFKIFFFSWKALTKGAILIASGRVPNTSIIFSYSNFFR